MNKLFIIRKDELHKSNLAFLSWVRINQDREASLLFQIIIKNLNQLRKTETELLWEIFYFLTNIF